MRRPIYFVTIRLVVVLILLFSMSSVCPGISRVSITEPGFTGWMSKHEITNAEYCDFLNEAFASGDISVSGNDALGSSGFNIGVDFVGQLYYDGDGPGESICGATDGGAARIHYNCGVFCVDTGFCNHPVTYVTWYGATAFCNYYGYRLPTSEQWQAVADYDGSFKYGCGLTIDPDMANICGSSHPDGTTAVGSFGAYGYGMCDMAGNVWEWTSSPYSGGFYILHGGSWRSQDDECEISNIAWEYPHVGDNNVGFRVCRPYIEVELRCGSTPGGTVISPGEGYFAYEKGDKVVIEARADKGYRFTNWSGNHWTIENPFTVDMIETMQMKAHFKYIATTLYVDDDAHQIQDGSFNRPYDSINKAILNASDGYTIVVFPGTYLENVDLMGKDLILTSVDPRNPTTVGFPVIDAHGMGPVLVNLGDTELEGLILTGGMSDTGAALSCIDTHLVLHNCLIYSNTATDVNGAALHFEDSNAVLVNCTIADNTGGERGAGLVLLDSELTISNSVIWNNVPMQILVAENPEPVIRYSNVDGWNTGEGNVDEDPLFSLMGDYHPASTIGRWNPVTQSWEKDPHTSPCIDAGDPDTAVGLEPDPNGERINMGAYGGTDQASMSEVVE